MNQLILVVEDDATMQKMALKILRSRGFSCELARSGREAVAMAAALKPALILMDLSLPVMDGWEATRRLKADERTRRIPVVALTGHALAGHSKGAREAGCDSFLAKPCLPDQLVAEIRRMLEGGKANITKTKGAR